MIQLWQHKGFGVCLDRTFCPEGKEYMMCLARTFLNTTVTLDCIDYKRDKDSLKKSTEKFGILELDVLDFITRLSVQVQRSL